MITAYNLEGVTGHYDALATLTLSDVSGEPRDDVSISIQENYDPDNPEPLRLEADELEELAGALDGDDIEATTAPDWFAIASTGEQPHTGAWRVYAQIEVEANAVGAVDSYVRLAYRVGDGPFGYTDRPTVRPHLAANLIEVDLGLVNLREAGSWSGRVEIRGDTVGLEFKLRALLFLPATHFARARAPMQVETPTAFVVLDDFDRAAGDLDGDTPPIGPGNWEEEGEAGNFGVTTLFGTPVIARTDTGDALWHVGFVDGATYADLAVRARVRFSALGDGTGFGGGVAIGKRISASAEFIVCGLAIYDADPNNCRFVFSLDGTEHPVEVPYRVNPNTDYEVTVQFLSSGIAAAWVTPAGGMLGEPLLVLDDDRLATGGTHDAGHVCVLDRWGFAASSTRTISKLSAWAPDTTHVVQPNQSARFTHETAESENAAGDQWGRVAHFEGARLKIPPSTRNGYAHRLVVKQDRNDLTQFPVSTALVPPELCTNPSAATDLTGWVNSGAVTFERTTSPPAGSPAPTTFHLVGNSDGDRGVFSLAVESGKTYRFSVHAYLDTSSATGIRLQVTDAGGGNEGNSDTLSALDAWTRLTMTVTANATETWQFRARQLGAGNIDAYFTSVSIKDVTEELTPALTVRPRVALASG